MARLIPKPHTLPDGTRILIRSLEIADAPDLISFRRHAALTSPHNVTQLDEIDDDLAEDQKWISEHLEDPGRLAIIATLARGQACPRDRDLPCGQIIGQLDFRCGKRRVMRHHGRFGISVVQSWRGGGVGRILITTLLDWARTHEFLEKICLGVFENNTRARKLYAALGFTEDFRTLADFKMPDGTYINDIQMSQWVKDPPPQRGGGGVGRP